MNAQSRGTSSQHDISGAWHGRGKGDSWQQNNQQWYDKANTPPRYDNGQKGAYSSGEVQFGKGKGKGAKGGGKGGYSYGSNNQGYPPNHGQKGGSKGEPQPPANQGQGAGGTAPPLTL